MLGILLAVIAAAALIAILMSISGGKKKKGGMQTKGGKRSKSNALVIKECTKKLLKDPHNVEALTNLSDIYYSEGNYEKAFPPYSELFRIMGLHNDVNQQLVAVRYGICAYKLGKQNDAMTAFSKAMKLNNRDFHTNLYVGKIMYDRKEFDKAIAYLKRAMTISPESSEIAQPLGYALFEAKKYRESLNYLKKVLDETPDNKETLFYFAIAMKESSMAEKSLKYFMHLRTDPKFGAQACIEAGILHERQGAYDKAIQDYEIALKLETITQETKINVYYKLAQALIFQKDISNALNYLKQINIINPNYKDVSSLIARYQELNQNSNLQAYLMCGTSDFVVLCKKFVMAYYKAASVKIEDVTVSPDNVEITCSVESSKWTDLELFRFYRSTGAIGELYIRDCHSKMRDIRCDRGFCITPGTFSDEARKYVDGRPIDLIEKSRLVQVLKRINMSN